MDLSVIIVSFNVSSFLKQCLISVIKASENISCEIFVVDNNSYDNSCEIVLNEFPQVSLIQNKVNLGFAVANNQAIKLSTGRFILLLNPDTIIPEDTFSKCISFMNLHKDAGAVGVRMINGEGNFLPESKRSIPTVKTAFFKTFGFSNLFPGSKIFNKYYLTRTGIFETSKSEVISGAFMFLSHKALEKTGLLDEDYFMYGEDIDISYRLLKNGFTNYYYPEIQIVHFKGRSTNTDDFTDIGHFYRAMRIYVQKRSGEGNIKFLKYLIIPGIYFRELLANLNRLLKITISR